MSSSAAKQNSNMSDNAKAEIVAAEGLRASHEILSVLEKCKTSSEEVISSLPDMLFITTLEGRILKGNYAAASAMGIDIEDLLDRNIFDLFKSETARIIKQSMATVLNKEASQAEQLELPIIGDDDQSIDHLWTISTFNQVSDRRGPILKILGKDISKIKDFEKKLSQIFSAIPLGIFTINNKGQIEWPYSLYSEYLVGQSELRDKEVMEAFFKPLFPNLSSTERAGIEQLIPCIGSDLVWFEMTKLHFPKQVRNTTKTANGNQRELWLGISYHPIVHDNTVEKIMIVLEDRTEVVEAHQALEIQRKIDDNRIKKIMEIQNCSGALLESTFQDFEILFPRMMEEVSQCDREQVARTLHGIKGIARTSGFSDLEHQVHALEDQILQDEKFFQSNENIDKFHDLQNEWTSLRSLCFALSGKQYGLQIERSNFTQAIDKLHKISEIADSKTRPLLDDVLACLGGGSFIEKVSLDVIKERLSKQVEITADALGKECSIEFDIANIQVMKSEVPSFSEIFLHLVNNSLDHGLEDKQERLNRGKDAVGKVCISATSKKDRVVITVKDDGQGIDSQVILQKAIEKEIITAAEASKLHENSDILQLMLKPGFSTKEELNTISGRGVGLDSVSSAIKALGGSKLKIQSELGKGTSFVFDVPNSTDE